jgi:uncharacterized membrane protein YhhN
LQPFWFGLTLALTATEWLSQWQNWKWPHYIAKPGAMIALIIWSWQVCHWQGGMLWFGLGLILSLVGDVLLMLPERYFQLGLVSFLSAHLLYIIGLRSVYVSLQPVYLLVFALVFTAIVLYLRVVLRALSRKSTGEKMRIPVMLYGIVIGSMLFSAILTLFQPAWTAYSAGLVAIGALSFCVSDSLLAYNRFVVSFANADFWVMLTYLSGQIAITAGALFHFCG